MPKEEKETKMPTGKYIKGALQIRKCIVCQKEFKPFHNHNWTCSHQCGIKHRDRLIAHTTYKCEICGKEKTETKYKYDLSKHHYCSKECYYQAKPELVEGENNGMFGRTHTEEVKRKLAEERIKNPNVTITKGGTRKDLGETYFRSTWESNYARILNHLGKKWEYEKKMFFFKKITKGSTSYTPDFKVYNEKDYEWVEIKGWMTKQGATKIKRFAKYFPEEFKKMRIIQQKEYKTLEKEYEPKIPEWEHSTNKEAIKKGGLRHYYRQYYKEKEEQINNYLEQKNTDFILIQPQGIFTGIFFEPKKISFFSIQKRNFLNEAQKKFINDLMPPNAELIIVNLKEQNQFIETIFPSPINQ